MKNQILDKEEKWRKLERCPYQQNLILFCGEDCGKGDAADCPIYLQGSMARCVTCGADTRIELELTGKPHLCVSL